MKKILIKKLVCKMINVMILIIALVWVWMLLKIESYACLCFFFCVGLMHYSRDPQIRILANFSLKLGPTVLFTHLKIILLQYFQFSVISSIQTDHR